jgi:hypothetical protein
LRTAGVAGSTSMSARSPLRISVRYPTLEAHT